MPPVHEGEARATRQGALDTPMSYPGLRPPPYDEQGHPQLMAVTQQEIESRLWDAADELRVAMPEAQYSSVMFPLMFWKYLSDTWEHHHQEFLAENEGVDGLSAEEAREIEYRDYQSFEIPVVASQRLRICSRSRWHRLPRALSPRV